MHDIALKLLLFLVQGSELAVEACEFAEVAFITSVFFFALFESFVEAFDKGSKFIDYLKHVFLPGTRFVLPQNDFKRVFQPFLLLLGFLSIFLKFTLVVEVVLLFDKVFLEFIGVMGETGSFRAALFDLGLAEIFLLLFLFFNHYFID